MNPANWKEAVQEIRAYFPDDAVVLGIVPENDEALKSSVLQFLAKTDPSAPVKDAGETAGKRYHTVGSGETLYNICKRYGLTVEKILHLNKMDEGAVIHAGQKILVGD